MSDNEDTINQDYDTCPEDFESECEELVDKHYLVTKKNTRNERSKSVRNVKFSLLISRIN